MNRRELLGTWSAPDPAYLKAVELWKGYYRDCDIFDGTTGPVPLHLRAESTAYALMRRREMAREALDRGLTDEIMKDARNRALDEYERETENLRRPR